MASSKQKTNNRFFIFVEIQTGDCFEEDIDRRDDDYGRVEETNEECRARNKISTKCTRMELRQNLMINR